MTARPIDTSVSNLTKLISIHESVLTDEEQLLIRATLNNYELSNEAAKKSKERVIKLLDEVLGNIRKRGVR